MSNRAERRRRTEKKIQERLDKFSKAPESDCIVFQNIISEPHRLAKHPYCNETGCPRTKCPFHSKIKQSRSPNTNYRYKKKTKKYDDLSDW